VTIFPAFLKIDPPFSQVDPLSSFFLIEGGEPLFLLEQKGVFSFSCLTPLASPDVLVGSSPPPGKESNLSSLVATPSLPFERGGFRGNHLFRGQSFPHIEPSIWLIFYACKSAPSSISQERAPAVRGDLCSPGRVFPPLLVHFLLCASFFPLRVCE